LGTTHSVAGTDWQSWELDVIVADYFAMLQSDLAGVPYVKAVHRRQLQSVIKRSAGSIEFKYQNISAVLDQLGAAWIPGYKPARNFQNALIDAVDRYLSKSSRTLYELGEEQPKPISPHDVFVNPPVPSAGDIVVPDRLRDLVRKFDPVERDHRNRSLGKAGEQFVFELEKQRLHQASRADLAEDVCWIAQDFGDGAGYDILSFNPNGQRRLIEVKTTNGSAETPFFLSANEAEKAAELSNEWCLYRVHLFSQGPRIFTLAHPLSDSLHLTVQNWRASPR
jgi:Domain of unknown function (DUF3883)